MVLLSSDVSNRSSIAMDCSSVAAAMVPHPMKQRGEPAGGNAVSSSAPPSSWHHKHEQLMLMEKQKSKGKTSVHQCQVHVLVVYLHNLILKLDYVFVSNYCWGVVVWCMLNSLLHKYFWPNITLCFRTFKLLWVCSRDSLIAVEPWNLLQLPEIKGDGFVQQALVN